VKDDVAIQRLWVSLQKSGWRVLAVLGTSNDDSSLEVANALADVAWQFRGEPTIMVDLTALGLRLVDYQKQRIEERRAKQELVVVALASIDRNPASIGLARAADAAVLVVRPGVTCVATVERAIEEVGRGKVAGIIVAKPKPRPVFAQLVPAAATAPAGAKT